MTVETALYPTQLNPSWPLSTDMVSEGDDHIRLLKTVDKTTWPNVAGVVSASNIELSYAAGVTSPIQGQINGKGSISGQTWSGTHIFGGATFVSNLPQGTNNTGAANTAFVQNEWATRLPNYTIPITASSVELNRVAGVTSPIQTQLDGKSTRTGDTYTGTHNYTGATVSVQTYAPGSSGSAAASLDFVNSAAFSAALPAQTGNAGKVITTNGSAASWTNSITGPLTVRAHLMAEGEGSTDGAEIDVSSRGYASGPVMHGYRANGSKASPTAANNGDLLYGIGSRPYDGTQWSDHSTAAFHWLARENITPTAQGTTLRAVITPLGSAMSARQTAFDLEIDSASEGARFRVKAASTLKQRFYFQGFPADGANTSLGVLPSGAGGNSQLNVFNAFDPTDSAYIALRASPISLDLLSGATGAGTNLPFNLLTASTVRLSMDANGLGKLQNSTGFGYGTGSGGTVTQTISKTTAVTINKPSGAITTHNANLNANTVVAFQVNNSVVETSDVIAVSLTNSGGSVDGQNYNVWTVNAASGSFYICVKNISAGVLGQALTINFVVHKASQS
ncbi:hypothetical protein [Delftia acidovorans]|uniref:Uncharacterized protein n=1 Tax=Delftia acidovorans TaxID=80866 RepID=A0AAJ2R318_DELAC|nr:hypothetical protein [Delftia acidovorans]MDX4957229.1 hypothetical protein [Delftia acidovorans]